MQYHVVGSKVIEPKCPKCDSEDDTTWGSFDVEEGGIRQLAYCDACDIEWYDVYQLVRQEVVERE